jgi:hypothetical protein
MLKDMSNSINKPFNLNISCTFAKNKKDIIMAVIEMNPSIVKVYHEDDYILRLYFTNGDVRHFSVAPKPDFLKQTTSVAR